LPASANLAIQTTSTRGEVSASPARVVPDPPPRTLHDKKKAGRAVKNAATKSSHPHKD
jgi:hypothetical protein